MPCTGAAPKKRVVTAGCACSVSSAQTVKECLNSHCCRVAVHLPCDSSSHNTYVWPEENSLQVLTALTWMAGDLYQQPDSGFRDSILVRSVMLLVRMAVAQAQYASMRVTWSTTGAVVGASRNVRACMCRLWPAHGGISTS